MSLSTPSTSSGGNTNLNSKSSMYAKKYGHKRSDLIEKMFTKRKKKKP